MSWFRNFWQWCCGTKQVEQQEEEEEIYTPPDSHSSLVADGESSENSEKMGKIFSRFGQCKKSEDSTPFAVHVDTPPSDGVQSDTQSLHTPTTPLPSGFPHYPLATPRSPINRRLREDTTPDASPLRPPLKRLKGDLQYLDFPILKDDPTINYIRQSKVIVILKGLPGSGKSYLAEKICELYQDVTVCSADKYFMQNGEYQFDKDKLSEAHQSCQQVAKEASENNKPIIVIDNTNVRNWEMRVYLELAQEYRYVPLVLESQTPWAMSPQELLTRNKHGLDEKILTQKLKSYQPVRPLYYGWFLNEADSVKICDVGMDWLHDAVKVEQFCRDLSNHINVTDPEELINTYSRQTYRDGGHILHSTANFTARGKAEGSLDYIECDTVKSAMGKCSTLHIIGFIITPRTFGARLKLTTSQLELWAQDDNEAPYFTVAPSSGAERTKRKNMEVEETTPQDNKIKSLLPIHTPIVQCAVTVTTQVNGIPDEDRFHPTSGNGSRAHITLGCAPGVKPVTTGLDMVSVVRREQEAKDALTDTIETYTLPGGMLRNYGDGMWVLYLDTELQVTSMFSAYYG